MPATTTHAKPLAMNQTKAAEAIGVGMFTYFIQRIDGGPIKIGKAKYIRSRLWALQGASPVQLICLAYFAGDFELEVHRLFHSVRLAGEWFNPDPTLLAFIAEHAQPCGMTVPLLTPDQVARKWARRQELDDEYQARRPKHWFQKKPKTKRVPWEA